MYSDMGRGGGGGGGSEAGTLTCTYFVFDIPHQWSYPRGGRGVRIALHAALQELLLLRILLQGDKEISHIILFLLA